MQIVIDIPEDVYKRTVFYREFKELNDLITTIKALEEATPLPKGHGKLIDANELQLSMFEENWTGRLNERELAFFNTQINKAPTIIPADEEDDGI